MRFFYFILIAIIMCSCENDKLLQFDGLYQSSDSIVADYTVTAQMYLRFYPNGKVISVTSTGSASEIIPWFNLSTGEKNFSVGNYNTEKTRITFSTTSESGTVNYEGEIVDKNHLDLKIKSLINGHQSEHQYTFIKIPNLK